MRWFERYGIPGIYFVLLLAAFYWIIFGFQPSINARMIVAVFAVAISASLPAGYILSIISLRIYYLYRPPWQVHNGPWHQAGEELRKAGEKLCESNIKSEEIVEAEVAVLGRLKIKDREADKRRWFQEWCTKRMDVLAINHTIIWATIIGWLLGVVIILGSFFRNLTTLKIKWFYLVLLGVISVLIILVLISSIRLLNKQVRHALVKFFTDLRKLDGKTTPSNNG